MLYKHRIHTKVGKLLTKCICRRVTNNKHLNAFCKLLFHSSQWFQQSYVCFSNIDTKEHAE